MPADSPFDPRFADTATLGFRSDGPAPEPQPGNRYSPRSPVASGGLGEVLLAEDSELRREVALKRLLPRHADNAGLRRRFLTEAEITAHLEHPGVVPVHGLYRDPEGRPCYAMRFIRGETLRDAIERFHSNATPSSLNRRLEFRELLSRFVAVCNTIAYAHSRGILHRDIKPHNIMLGRYGETLVVDWGLAKPFHRGEIERSTGEESLAGGLTGSGESDTQMGSAVGTPAYMSPEQAAGRWNIVGTASDVYSLGATLYQLLTGRPPFQGEDAFATLQQVQSGKLVPPRSVKRDVPRALEAICLKAMSIDPGARYVSALDLAADVQRWLADEPVTCLREPIPVRVGRWARRRRTLVSGLAALVVTALIALTISNLLIRREQSRTTAALDEAREQRTKAEENFRIAEEQRKLAADNEKRAHLVVAVALMQIGMSLSGEEAIPKGPEFETGISGLIQGLRLGRVFFADGGPMAGILSAEQRAMGEAAWVLGSQRMAKSLRAGDYDEVAEAVLRDALELARGLKGRSSTQLTNEHIIGLEAHVLLDLADLLVESTDPAAPEALDHYRQAAVHYRTLRAKEPTSAAHADYLRYTLAQLGNIHIQNNDWKGAEAAYRESIALCEELVKQGPLNLDYHMALTASHAQMAHLHQEMKELDKAAAVYTTILRLREPLLKEPPQAASIAISQAETLHALANLEVTRGRHEAAAAWNEKAFALMEPFGKRYPSVDEVKAGMRNAYWGRANAYHLLKNFAGAILDWEKTIELSGETDHPRIRRLLAVSRAASGDHAKAVAEAEPLAADANIDGGGLHDLVRVFAAASASAARDTKLPENERKALAKKYADRAIALLARARNAGAYKETVNVEDLRTGPDLESIRARPEVQKLLRGFWGM